MLAEGTLSVTDSRTGARYELPITASTVRAMDLRQIRTDPDEFGLMSYDPGYTNTAACTSRVAYLDGARGVLRYRGYPIEDLAKNCTYTEVAHLLMRGHLPTSAELHGWDNELASEMRLPPGLPDLIETFPAGAHPMVMLASTVAALGTYYPDGRHVTDTACRHRQRLRLLAKIPLIAALIYRRTRRYSRSEPRPDLGYAGNFLHMLWQGTSRQLGPQDLKVLAKALDALLVLHAEHEQNCSTSTMRQVASSEADPYVSLAAAVAALSGPLHGGANERVLQMLDEIGSTAGIPAFMRSVKAGERRMMGFGHRVYKNYDPRARVLQDFAEQVFETTGKNPKIALAVELERIALQDDYFVRRKLYPNVDFYSGIIYEAMGFPPEMFTVLFAIGRVAGWLTHWDESMADPERRIARPRQIYRGPGITAFVPIEARGRDYAEERPAAPVSSHGSVPSHRSL